MDGLGDLKSRDFNVGFYGIPSIFDGIFHWKRGCLGNSEPKKWRSQLSEDEMTEFLTKCGWKKCNNTQNILLGWSYLLFEEYLQEKNICLYTETGPRNRPKSWRNSKNLNLLIEVYLIRLSYDVKNYADLGGGRKQHAFSSSKILDIYSASFNNC